MLRQYLLKIELGKATDNSFSHGKVLEKSTFEHLKGKRQILEKHLAQIRSSHQRDAFKQAGIHLQSKEAYDLAVKAQWKISTDVYIFLLIFNVGWNNLFQDSDLAHFLDVGATDRWMS